jgi:hypothetical protein
MFTRSLTFLLTLIAASAADVPSLRSSSVVTDEIQNLESVSLFRAWADIHDKIYPTKEEMKNRLQIWLHNHGTFFNKYKQWQ